MSVLLAEPVSLLKFPNMKESIIVPSGATPEAEVIGKILLKIAYQALQYKNSGTIIQISRHRDAMSDPDDVIVFRELETDTKFVLCLKEK